MTPEPASTVVLVRDGSGGLEVFLVRRHRDHAFMGGTHVCPGGRVDDDDRRAGAASIRHPFLHGSRTAGTGEARIAILPGDRTMPALDGFEATEKRFLMSGGRWTPET